MLFFWYLRTLEDRAQRLFGTKGGAFNKETLNDLSADRLKWPTLVNLQKETVILNFSLIFFSQLRSTFRSAGALCFC